MKEALKLSYFEEVRDPDREIVMKSTLSFPFEYDSGSYEIQLMRLRRLLYNETVEFSYAVERVGEE